MSLDERNRCGFRTHLVTANPSLAVVAQLVPLRNHWMFRAPPPLHNRQSQHLQINAGVTISRSLC